MMPDSQVIDQTVGEALGYWQIGDLDSLHKYYSDDVVVVSGLWEPPIIGWANYAKAYTDQRHRVYQGQRMDRSNTLIKVNGNSRLGHLSICLFGERGRQRLPNFEDTPLW